MKYLRYVLLGLCVIAILIVSKNFIRKDHEDHNHAQQNDQYGDHDHSHDSDGVHEEETGHALEGDDHDHSIPASHSTPDDMIHDHGDEHSHDSYGAHEEAPSHAHEGDDQDHSPDSKEIIQSLADWEKLIGLRVETVQRKEIEEVIHVPGQIIPNQNQMAVVNPFLEASVNCIFVNIGDRVKVGDELACLTSPEVGILRAEYNKAKAEHEIKIINYERKENLFQENIISEKVFQEAELEMRVADVNYEYAMKKLLAIGIAEEELDHPPEGHSNAVGSTIHLYAPMAGVITTRDAKIGQKVDQSNTLFEIINLQTVWCEADIFEKDLQKVHLQQKVNIQVTAYPETYFSGRIFFIASVLNPETKTTKIMIEIENESENLKPGMFANTQIVIGKKMNALVLPVTAVMKDEQLQVVFIKETTGYHRHIIQTGIVSDPNIEILSGIQEGDQVVIQGHYQLMSKWKMQGVDSHAGHVH